MIVSMNTKIPFKLLSARMLLTPLLLITLPLSAADTSFRAGAAQVDITPPTGTAMAGQYNKRLSTGVAGPYSCQGYRGGAGGCEGGHGGA